MQRIVPHLWFDRQADAAAEFYCEALPHTTLLTTSQYPTEGLPDFQQDFAGKTLTAELEIDGLQIVLINASDEFYPNPSISFLLNFDPSRDPDAAGTLDATWQKLSEGGTALMPLDEYSFSPRYGWIQDRFGVSWQLMLTNPDGEPRPFVTPQLMFGGDAQNRAKEAIDYYLATFQHSRTGTIVPYPEPTGPAPAGGIMFAEFQLENQWFSAMDSGVEQHFSFTHGVSLAVKCRDQDEIDRYWAALSTVREAEQCGWCIDQFGVSWQIQPENITELMADPACFQRLEHMKKIDIAELIGE